MDTVHFILNQTETNLKLYHILGGASVLARDFVYPPKLSGAVLRFIIPPPSPKIFFKRGVERCVPDFVQFIFEFLDWKCYVDMKWFECLDNCVGYTTQTTREQLAVSVLRDYLLNCVTGLLGIVRFRCSRYIFFSCFLWH